MSRIRVRPRTNLGILACSSTSCCTPCKLKRFVDGKWVTCVLVIFEGSDFVFIALDTIAQWYWPLASYGDKNLRKLVVAQACAQLSGFAKPLSVSEFVLPVISKVVDNLGIDGPKTVMYVTDRNGREVSMYASEYAKLIETTVIATIAESSVPAWVSGESAADFFNIVRERRMWEHDEPEEEEQQEEDLQPAMPTSGEIDEEEQWTITKNDINTSPACPAPKHVDALPAIPYTAAVVPRKTDSAKSAVTGRTPPASASPPARGGGPAPKDVVRDVDSEGGPAPKGSKHGSIPAKAAPAEKSLGKRENVQSQVTKSSPGTSH